MDSPLWCVGTLGKRKGRRRANPFPEGEKSVIRVAAPCYSKDFYAVGASLVRRIIGGVVEIDARSCHGHDQSRAIQGGGTRRTY